MPLRPIAADDIFISYTRLDARLYATGLARELRNKGFSCFLDTLGTVPDSGLPDMLRQKIRECRMFVVVCTERAAGRETIEEEVKEFLSTGRRSSIVPINFDGAVYKARWYGLIEGVAPEPELDPDALGKGTPSPSVIERIELQFKYARRNQRLRRATIGTAALLMLLILASVAAGIYARRQIGLAREYGAAAEQARTEAGARRAEAEAAKNEAAAQREAALSAKTAADQARAEADAQKTIADKATREAEAKTRLADAASRRADTAAAAARAAKDEADRQQAVALSRSDANRSQTILRQRPDEVPRSLTIAARALKKAQTLEADEALRNSLALLPRRSRPDLTLGNDIRDTAFSPDGRYFATVAWDNKLRVYELGNEAHPRELPCECSRVALSLGPASAAVITPAGLELIDLKSGVRRVLKIDESGPPNEPAPAGQTSEQLPPRGKSWLPKRIALSPAGRYLAVTYDNSDERDRVSVLKVIDTSDGKAVQTLLDGLGLQVNDIAFGPSGNLAVGAGQPNPGGGAVGRAVVWLLSGRLPEAEAGAGLTAADFSRPIDLYQDDEIKAVALGADDSLLATDRAVFKTYARREYEPIVRLPAPAGGGGFGFYGIKDVAFNGGGDRVAVVRDLPHDDADYIGSPKVLEVWDAAGYREAARAPLLPSTAIFRGQPGLGGVAPAPDSDPPGVTYPIRSADGATVLTTVRTESLPTEFVTEVEAQSSVTISENTAEVWNGPLGKKLPLPPSADFGNVVADAVTPDGKFVALAGTNISLYVLDRGAYRLDKVLTKPDPSVGLGLTPDGRILVTEIVESNGLQVWRTSDEKEVKLEGLDRLGSAVGWRLSPEGHYLAAGTYGGGINTVYVWRMSDGALLKNFDLPGPRGSLSLIVFDPRERFLLAATRDDQVAEGKTHLLDLSRVVDHVMPVIESVSAAAFSADAQYLALSIGGDVYVYPTADPETAIAHVHQDEPVSAIAFSADGTRLVTATGRVTEGPDGEPSESVKEGESPLRVWLLRPDELITEADKRLAELPEYAR